MEIYTTGKVSAKFYGAALMAGNNTPDYFQKLSTKIILGRTLHDIQPSLSKEWKRVPYMYRPVRDEIYIGEYTCYSKARKEKNETMVDGLFHESFHALDLQVFGHLDYEHDYYGAFSTCKDTAFWGRWNEDLSRLKDNPKCLKGIDKIFNRHMNEDGSGALETFAELGANIHGYSTLKPWGIHDIRKFWPRSLEVIEDRIQSLQ